MSAAVKRVVLRTPAAVGGAAQYSALELCRIHSESALNQANTAVSASGQAQASAAVASAARDAALAAVGAVKTTAADQSAGVLDDTLAVAAPLNKTVLSPGGDETLRLSVSVMAGASASQPGAAGVVPAPPAGGQLKYLRGDAVWQALDKATLGLSGVEDTWTKLSGAVTRLSAAQAAVAGDCVGFVMPGGSPGRAIKPDLPAGLFGYVADASYDAANTRTVITVDGFEVSAEHTELWIGQDTRNAPQSSSTGSDLYLASNCNSFTY
jgi:hypothetical protein